VQIAADLETALAGERWDAVISDYKMPGFTGMDALRIFRSTGLDIPFILISGTIGEETAVEAMKAGASDYLMKTSLARLAPALERELKEAQMRATLRRDHHALTDSEERFRQMAENIHDAFVLRDVDNDRIIYISPAYEEIWGRSCESLYANPETWTEAIHSDDRASTYEKYKEVISKGRYEIDYRIVRPDGSIRWIESRGFPVRDDAGKMVRIAGVAKDITERKQAEDARKHREAELQESQRIARIGSWEWTIATSAITWSDGMNHVLARDRGSPSPTFETLPQFYTPDSWQRLGAVIAKAAETGASYDLDLEMIRADGATCWTTTRGEAIRGADGTVVKLRGTVHDITEQRWAETKIRRFNRVYAVLSGINTLIVRTRDRQELFDEACRIAVEQGKFQLAWIGLLDANGVDVVPVARAGVDEGYLDNIQLTARDDAPNRCEMVARALREKTVVVCNDIDTDPQMARWREEALRRGYRSVVVFPLKLEDKMIGLLLLYASEAGVFDTEEMRLLTELAGDISFALDHIDKQKRLNYIAYYDVLTGLANRSLFLERVAQHMRSAASGGHKLAVALIDLERFKNINDSLGRPAGDALLRQVAEWLTRITGDASLLARVGADHFAGVLPKVKQGGDMARLLDKWMEAFLDHPFRLNDAVFRIAAKVGVALFPDDGADADTLFKNAEAALKKAKLSGDKHLFYAPEFNAQIAEKLTLENKLHRALEQEQLVLHYQPKVNLKSGQICGLEALMRWNDPETGLVPPMKFIPLLEETGMILEAGRWALAKAASDSLAWQSKGLRVLRIAVNVSPIQLQQKDFVGMVAQVISGAGNTAVELELEITESLIMQDIEANIQKLRGIREMGIEVAIDDFGTGYSSLSYIAKLPVNALKIDRAFIINMTSNSDDLSIVSTIISLAHSLNLRVIAEGVETEEQANLLRLLKCDEIQGYLFSPAVPAERIEEFLRKKKSLPH
jgi:diguanylate cyclase (GGDEF)-like protein/PAS domain S-box-containing protein